MKKWIVVCICVGMLLSGCGQPAVQPETGAPETAVQPQTSETAAAAAETTDGYVDLTAMSSTMVYAEVFNMMADPEAYVGKTVKMKGLFGVGKIYEPDGSLADNGMIFSCVIQDATSCCAQGIPFDLGEGYAYPQDYPEVETEITVSGTFEIHQENGFQFPRLANAVMVVR